MSCLDVFEILGTIVGDDLGSVLFHMTGDDVIMKQVLVFMQFGYINWRGVSCVKFFSF